MLRTGRNQSNNELNTLARNRGQKESPMQRLAFLIGFLVFVQLTLD